MKTYAITIKDGYGETVVFEKAESELEAYCQAISGYEFVGGEDISTEELK